jgi:hypothetical protein
LSYFTKVDPSALDAELYSQVELNTLVRWGGRTLSKIPRGGPLTDFYPLKSFEVRFARPRDGDFLLRGQPTIEVVMRDRATDDDNLVQKYGIVMSLTSPSGDVLISELVESFESE